jgi:mono/diheme cytochrome c family protein
MPNFADAGWQSSRTDKQISDGISNGAGVMPGFKESLTAAQISALVKHVRAFGPKKK